MSESEAELKALMIAGLAGDRAAYRALLTALRDVLRRYYMRRTGPDDAEDLVQDALIAIHSRRATYDTSMPFTPWLFAVARYKLLDHRRRARVRAAVSLEDAGELAAEDESEAALARLDLESLLATLPESTRALIRQVKVEGLSTEEAARKSGRTEVAVRVGIHRGLKTLTEKLVGRPGREDR